MATNLKPLATVAGIDKLAANVQPVVNKYATEYIAKILADIVSILDFANKKTITVEDLNFYFKHFRREPQYFNPNDPPEITCLQKPFRRIIKDLTIGYRFEKSVPIFLQYLYESYIISLLTGARECCKFADRQVVTDRDVTLFWNFHNKNTANETRKP